MKLTVKFIEDLKSRGLLWSSDDHTGLATRGLRFNPAQGEKFDTFHILLLERTFKSLTTFGESVYLGSNCSLWKSGTGFYRSKKMVGFQHDLKR